MNNTFNANNNNKKLIYIYSPIQINMYVFIHLLSPYYVPDTPPDAGASAVNKGDKALLSWSLPVAT